MTDGVLTLQEAADELGVHYMTAYRYVRLGQLQAHKVAEIQRFFMDYKILENKSVEIDNILGAEQALESVIESFTLYRREENRLRGW